MVDCKPLCYRRPSTVLVDRTGAALSLRQLACVVLNPERVVQVEGFGRASWRGTSSSAELPPQLLLMAGASRTGSDRTPDSRVWEGSTVHGAGGPVFPRAPACGCDRAHHRGPAAPPRQKFNVICVQGRPFPEACECYPRPHVLPFEPSIRCEVGG